VKALPNGHFDGIGSEQQRRRLATRG
jgi:hypothetical protein